MTPLAGTVKRSRRRERWLWVLAASLVVGVHGAAGLAILGRDPAPPEAPAAAPLVMEVAFFAAAAPATEAAPPPVESPPEPPRQEPPPEPEIEPEVVLEELPEPEPPEAEPDPEPQPGPRPEPEQQQAEQQPEPAEQVATTPSPAVEAPEIEQVAAAPNLGVPDAQAVEAEQLWHSAVVAHLERRKRYPRQALVMRREGVPQVRFTLDRQGKVLEAALEKPSGETLLDREALALIRRAEPLPKPPPEVGGEQISLVVPVEFFIGP